MRLPLTCRWIFFLIGLWSATLPGCSKGGGKQTALVSGKVTVDGKPAGDVRVSFQPILAAPSNDNAKSKDAGVGSYATTDADGKFTLRFSDTDAPGAVVGMHNVRLSDKLAESNEDGGPVKAKPARFPAKYSDGSLTFEVKPEGTTEANFDLASK